MPRGNVQKKEYTQAFEVFDKDKDGFVTRQELKTIMRSLGQNPSEDDIEEMMVTADANQDGKISYDEFMTLISNQIKSSGMHLLIQLMYRGCR